MVTVEQLQQTLTQIDSLSPLLNQDESRQKIVEIIGNVFKFYFVGLFITDDAQSMAILKAGTGEIGRIMKQKAHQLPLVRRFIGPSISLNEVHLYDWLEEKLFSFPLPETINPGSVPALAQDSQQLYSPLLPETRWQLFIPVRDEKRSFGALEMQRKQDDTTFTPHDILNLLILTDQIAPQLRN